MISNSNHEKCVHRFIVLYLLLCVPFLGQDYKTGKDKRQLLLKLSSVVVEGYDGKGDLYSAPAVQKRNRIQGQRASAPSMVPGSLITRAGYQRCGERHHGRSQPGYFQRIRLKFRCTQRRYRVSRIPKVAMVPWNNNCREHGKRN
jgi:hypothetical protein